MQIAQAAGDDPKQVTLEPFVTHDLRRTVRTRLAELKIDYSVAEMVIGHAKKGLDVFTTSTSSSRSSARRWRSGTSACVRS